LHYFNPKYLSEVSSIVSAAFSRLQTSLTDNSYLEIILQISITLQRIEKQFVIDKDHHMKEKDIVDELHQMKKICKELEQKFDVAFSEGDILYLALVQKGTKLRGTETVPYDSIV